MLSLTRGITSILKGKCQGVQIVCTVTTGKQLIYKGQECFIHDSTFVWATDSDTMYVCICVRVYMLTGGSTISPVSPPPPRQYTRGQYPPGQYPPRTISPPPGNIPLDNFPPGVTTSSFLQKDFLLKNLFVTKNNISYTTRQDIVTIYGTLFLYSKGSGGFQN